MRFYCTSTGLIGGLNCEVDHTLGLHNVSSESHMLQAIQVTIANGMFLEDAIQLLHTNFKSHDSHQTEIELWTPKHSGDLCNGSLQGVVA